jgi:hypothetical protein
MAGVLSTKSVSGAGRLITPYRKLSVNALLGFHAPYLSMPDQKYSKQEVESAAQSMRQAILGLVRLASRDSMNAEFIKKSLLEGILSRGPEDVLFVKTVGDAARWDIDLYDAKKYFAMPTNKVVELINVCNNFHYSRMDKPVPQNSTYDPKVENIRSQYHDCRVLLQDPRTHDTVCEIYPTTMKAGMTFYMCSHDYWSSKSFGDCRDYKTKLLIGRAEYALEFYSFAPSAVLKAFSGR